MTTAEEKCVQRLDLSKQDVRVRCVLRRLSVDTAEKLLELKERDLLAMKNCGAKTVAKILQLQAEYGKEAARQKGLEAFTTAFNDSGGYMAKLFVVAIAAHELIEGAKKDGRYYFRVSRQRLNMLKETLEILKNKNSA